MPYATYGFNKTIAADTIRFIVTVAIVVYKGLIPVVGRILTVHMHITCSVYKSFDTDEACRTRTAFNLKSELETSNNSFKTVIDR